VCGLDILVCVCGLDILVCVCGLEERRWEVLYYVEGSKEIHAGLKMS